MEPFGAGNRSSGMFATRDRIPERTYASMPAMATPTMASPTSIYPNPPPPPYTGWPPHPLSRPSGLISPPESRRTSDNKTEPPPPIQTGPQRQSLPSLKEALSAGPGPSPNPYVSPVSASLTHSQQQLPYSSQPPPVPRSYATDHPSYPAQVAPSHLRRASPLRSIIHPQSSTFSRPDPIPSFGESSRRTSFSGSLIAPGPPPNPYRDTRYEAEQRRPMTNGYSHYPAPPQHQPVPAHYVPRSAVPHSVPQSSFTEHRFSQSRDHPGSWKAPEKTAVAPSQFRQGLKRTLDVWGFELDLEKIVEHSGSIQHWAQHYKQIASEQQTEIPDRMPTASSCQEQIDLAQIVMNSLVRARDIMKDQEYAASEESLRQQGGQKQADYDEEMSIYGDDSMKNGQGFNGEQSKKRRGRAAPPGRCHSCNRAETPEWRRGPDGARTLCNACGLHYAKLTRKNTMKQQQQSQGMREPLRPKTLDDHSPRPI